MQKAATDDLDSNGTKTPDTLTEGESSNKDKPDSDESMVENIDNECEPKVNYCVRSVGEKKCLRKLILPA